MSRTEDTYELHYVYKDHLGSWTTITNAGGQVIAEQSFDARGNMRDPDTWTGSFDGMRVPMFDRGFTGHEHLYGFGLINMNGRMYDPVMSGFLSPDNYVQAPDFSQSFNRYAYCFNNPLKYTDPDGEWIQYVIGGILGGINGYSIGKAAGLEGWDLVWSTVGGAAVGVATCGVGNYVTSAVGVGAGGAAGGAIGGFGYGVISAVANNSENVLEDALVGLGKGLVSGFAGAAAGVALPFGDSWGMGSLLGGATSNVTSQLLSHDWKSDEPFKLNWKSTLFSAGLSWGIYYGSSYLNYEGNVRNWNPKALNISFRQYIRMQGMYSRARFWRSEQSGGGFWLTRNGVSEENVYYNEKNNTVSFGVPKPKGALATVHSHPYDEHKVGQIDLWHSEVDLGNVTDHNLPSIVVNKNGAEIAYPGGSERNLSFWGSPLWGYGNPYYSYPYSAAKYYFNLRP